MDPLSVAGAVWWWVGIVILFLVVIPLLLWLVQRVLTHLGEISKYADDVLDHGLAVTKNLDPVPALVETRDLVRQAGGELGEYVATVDRLLGGRR